jgi:hypothetical protein
MHVAALLTIGMLGLELAAARQNPRNRHDPTCDNGITINVQ